MKSTRILSHGKIENISNGFKLSNGSYFSVYVRPKNDNLGADVLLNCKCICDKETSEIPIQLNDWTSAAIVEIAPNAISLEEYDVYWGAGNLND